MDENPSGWTPKDGSKFAANAIVEAVTKEKRPLYRRLPPALDFPIDALGPLKEAALAIHHRTQAPLAIAAQSVLAAATLAVQAQRDVILPAGGRKPLTGWFASIAESGERKSSVDRIALAPAYKVEEEWRKQSDGERLAYLNAKETWDFSRDQAKRDHRKNPTAIRAALDALGPEPEAPPHPMLLISDPTPEALTMHLADGRSFAGVFTAEGGLLIGGAAFSDESKKRTAALFNTLWDGDPIRRKRIGTGSTFLPGRRCSAHIMLQPIIADELFGNTLFDGIGLTARMLLVAPNSTAGTRLYREAPASSSAILESYNERIRFLLMRPPVTSTDMPDALDPPAMQLQQEARMAWIEFYNQCEGAVIDNGPLHKIKPFAGKLAEHAGRLAAVLTVYADPSAMEVPLWAMQCGIQLGYHYGSEMLRLADGASVPVELRHAQRLLDWWQLQTSKSLHLTYIYQFGPSNVRNAATARAAIKILLEHGCIEQLDAGTLLDGASRKEAWRLIP